MGKYLPNGDLEYLGRIDNQVKIRGYRIELEEIETLINQIDGVKQSIVIALETGETNKILQAYYTSDIDIDKTTISDYLTLKLPEYMIPVIYKRVESFFQTVNGKIDRKRVLECAEIVSEDSGTGSPNIDKLNDIQKKIYEIIISSLDLQINNATLETGFASSGIDSLTFIKIVVTLESEFEFEFDDEMLLITKFPTVKTMVEYVESKANT
jgi:acyl carrier protein